MEVVGKIYYYASGWTADTAVDIFLKGDQYFINLGPLNDIKKYAKTVSGLKSALAEYYKKDKKFTIKKIEMIGIDESTSASDKQKMNEQAQLAKKAQADADKKVKAETKTQADKQAKAEKKVKDEQEVNDASDKIKQQRAKQAAKMASVSGNFLQKAAKIYFISLMGFSKNLVMMLITSLSGAFSTGNKVDKIFNKYFFALIKDSFIVLTPLIVLNLIFDPWDMYVPEPSAKKEIVKLDNAYQAGLLDSDEYEEWKGICTTTQSGVKKIIALTGSKDDALAWCKATDFMKEIEFFIKNDIDIDEAVEWLELKISLHKIATFKQLGYSPEFIVDNNLVDVHPSDLFKLQKKYNKSLDEAVEILGLYKDSNNYGKMLAAFNKDESKLIEYTMQTGVSDIKVYSVFQQSRIKNLDEIKAWQTLFEEAELLKRPKAALLLMTHLRTVGNLEKFNSKNKVNLAYDKKLLNVLAPFFQKITDEAYLAWLIKVINDHKLLDKPNYPVNKIVLLLQQKKSSFDDIDFLLAHDFNYIFDNESFKKIREYARKFGLHAIVEIMQSGKTAEQTYKAIKK